MSKSYFILLFLALKITSFSLFAFELRDESVNVQLISRDSLRSYLENKWNLYYSKEWLFMPGDSSVWKQTDYNDSHWQKLPKAIIYFDSSYAKDFTGIGWFRMKFKIDSTLKNSYLAILVFQNCASEFYLNGKLLQKFGHVSNNSKDETLFNPQFAPIIFYVGEEEEYTLAIRFSGNNLLERNKSLGGFSSYLSINAGFTDYYNGINFSLNRLKINLPMQLTLFGILFSLAVFHFFIFIFNKKEKDNLYYSLFCLIVAILFYTSFFQITNDNPLNIAITQILSLLIIPSLFLTLLMFIYNLHYRLLPKIIYVFLVLGIALLVSTWFFFISEISKIILLIFIIAVFIEVLRVTYLIIKSKKEGSKLIGLGLIGFLLNILFFVFMNSMPELTAKVNTSLVVSFIIFGFTSIPLAMSIYLAKKIGATNKTLEQKLVEVQTLSEKNLLQERKHAELMIQNEKELSKAREAELRAKAAELQVQAAEAQAKILQAENERKSKELEDARQLQLSMLPREVPEIDGWEISVYMQTAAEVGGDYYDFQKFNSSSFITVIGDATGHGTKAGTMVTAAKSLFLTKSNSENLSGMLNEFNTALKKMNFGMLYMCLSLLKINKEKVIYSNAGMPHLLWYKNYEKQLHEFNLKAMPLGAFNEYKYDSVSFNVSKGDTLFLYSDGFPEMFNNEKELFNYDTVKSKFLSIAHLNPHQIIKELEESINSWTKGNPPHDDITFVVLKKI